MDDAVIKFRGALVAILEKKDDPVHFLCVAMPRVPHETRLRYKAVGGHPTSRLIGGPLRFVASPTPTKGKHTKAGIISAADIELGIPLYQKAANVILLPPGNVAGGTSYPCNWKIGNKSIPDICSEIVVTLPGVTALEAHYGSIQINLDPNYAHVVTHLPLGAHEKPGEIPKMDHFDHYAHVGSHGNPALIKIPQIDGTCIVAFSVSSVCPPVGYP